jgi:hypothetical protein
VLLVLLVLPGGLGRALVSARDALVARVARRRGLLPPDPAITMQFVFNPETLSIAKEPAP